MDPNQPQQDVNHQLPTPQPVPSPFADPVPNDASPQQQPTSPQPQPANSKYSVIRALGDGVQAILANFPALIIVACASFLLAGLVLVGGILAIAAAVTNIDTSFYSSSFLWVILAVLILYMIWYACAYAFVMATTSLALADGHQGRSSSIGGVFKRALSALPKIILTNFIYMLAVFLPLLLTSIGAALISIVNSSRDADTSSIFIILFVIAGIAWALIATFRYALSPYVALFEPEVPTSKTLSRSYHLLKHGGQWFLIKGYVLLLILLIILSAASGSSSLTEFQSSDSIIGSLGSILLILLANSVLVVLYFNRKAVRG